MFQVSCLFRAQPCRNNPNRLELFHVDIDYDNDDDGDDDEDDGHLMARVQCHLGNSWIDEMLCRVLSGCVSFVP